MKNNNPVQTACLFALTIIATLLAPFELQAESAIWSGTTSDLWSLPGNWVGSPAVPGAGDTATFNSAGGSTTISLGSGVTINNIFFDTANAAAYTIGTGARDSQTLTLGASGGVTADGSVASNQTVNASLLLSSNTADTESFSLINNSSGATLYFAGNVLTSSLLAGAARTLNVGGSGDISANVVKRVGLGTLTLVKSGTGTLSLNDPPSLLTDNTDNYSLSLVANEGTVILNKVNTGRRAIGGTLTASNNALIRLAGSNGDQIYDGVDCDFTDTASLDMNGRNETLDAFNGTSNTKVYNSANGTASKFVVGGGNNSSTFNGLISDNAGSSQTGTLAFGKTGTGTHTLTGTNTYTGVTYCYGGNLGVKSLTDIGNCNIGSGSIVLEGGTLQYTGTNNVTLSARKISANNTGASGIDVVYSNTTLTVDQGFAGNGGGTVTKKGSGTLALTGPLDNNSLILIAAAGTTKLGKTVAGQRAVAGIKDIQRGATVQLTGTGGDQIYGGNTSGNTGRINMSGGTLDMNAKSETIAILQGAGLVVNNGATGTESLLTIGEINASEKFSGAIQDGVNNGVMALRKIGSGTLTLAYGMGFTNTYSGVTTISGGTLQLAQPPKTPIAGSSLWLDAADTASVTLNSGAVSAWADKSGNNRNATQTTAANQPIYNTNAKVGGLSVLHFDGVNDLLDVDLSFLAASDYTMFIVEGRQENDGAYFLGTSTKTDNDTNEKLHVGYRDHDSFTQAHYGMDLNYDSATLVYDGTQVFRQWTTSLQKLTPGAGKSIALNGQLVAGPATGIQTNQMDSALGGRIGSGYAGGAQYYTGDICEILIYNRNLSAAEKVLVEAYLSCKWFDDRTATGVLPTNTTVNLAASGATLDLNGVTQPIDSLIGVTGALITLNEGTLTVAGTNNTIFAGTISGTGTLVKAGSGILTLTAADALPATGSLKLAGGTLDLSAVTSSAASLLVAANSTLELGAGTGAISFDNQSAAPWSGMLTISGTLSAQSVRFQPVLTAPQLAAIRFATHPGAHATCTAEGYLAIIPSGTIILLR